MIQEDENTAARRRRLAVGAPNEVIHVGIQNGPPPHGALVSARDLAHFEWGFDKKLRRNGLANAPTPRRPGVARRTPG